jgi:AbrB family looped-hinge helix DNA binding protein
MQVILDGGRMTTSKLTSKGQITIPKEIRERLGVGPGDKLRFLVNEHGKVQILSEKASQEAIIGFLKDKPRKRKGVVTVEEMKETVRQESVKTGKKGLES